MSSGVRIMLSSKSAPQSPICTFVILMLPDHLLNVWSGLEQNVLKELECLENAVGGPHDLVVIGINVGNVGGGNVLNVLVAVPD